MTAVKSAIRGQSPKRKIFFGIRIKLRNALLWMIIMITQMRLAKKIRVYAQKTVYGLFDALSGKRPYEKKSTYFLLAYLLY